MNRVVISFDEADRLRLEILISEIAASFTGLPYGEIDRRVEETLTKILNFLQLDRSTVWYLSKTSAEIAEITHLAARPGVRTLPRLMTSRDFPWCYHQTFIEGRELKFSGIDDLPEEAAKDKKTLRSFDPHWSAVIIPLKAGSRVIGAITFGTSGERIWPEELLYQLRLLGHILAGALSRRQTEEELHKALREVECLKKQLQQENVYLKEEVKVLQSHGKMIGQSQPMRTVLEKVRQVAATNSTVLLIGETGVGKELVASAIHESSARNQRTMVRVNCGGIPTALVESELFGREKGAYTGALTRQLGRFELADNSTIFLDEIAELLPEVQVKFLRVLQEREIERLGNPRPIPVNVRVIAATNQDLGKAVREGKFRQDLFYRLNVFPIEVPPLRERRDDIAMLVWNFVDEFSIQFGKKVESISRETMDDLLHYSWPGNVRELRNTIERAMIISNSTKLRIEVPQTTASAVTAGVSLEEFEALHIRKTLEACGWRIRGKNGAAEILSIKPTTLESRMMKLGINRPLRNKI